VKSVFITALFYTSFFYIVSVASKQGYFLAKPASRIHYYFMLIFCIPVLFLISAFFKVDSISVVKYLEIKHSHF
jgi:hypothetical protein